MSDLRDQVAAAIRLAWLESDETMAEAEAEAVISVVLAEVRRDIETLVAKRRDAGGPQIAGDWVNVGELLAKLEVYE